MKLNFSFLLIGFCFFISCNDEYIRTDERYDAMCAIRFRIDWQPDIEPFPDTKSIPQKFPPEPSAIKSDSEGEETNDLTFSYIEYAVYDAAADTLVRHIRFSKDNTALDDFGTFIYDTLKVGSYKICALTHSTAEVMFADHILSFPQISDTFYGSLLVDIHPNHTDEERDILLRRMVSRVEFVATDPVPDKVETFHIAVAERYNKINLFSGEVVEEATPYTFNHTFTEAERGDDVFNTHAFYTFVLSGNQVSLPEAVLIAKDEDHNEVRKRIIKDIPVVANKITRYKGILYTRGLVDDNFNLTFENDGKWGSPIEEDLPED